MLYDVRVDERVVCSRLEKESTGLPMTEPTRKSLGMKVGVGEMFFLVICGDS